MARYHLHLPTSDAVRGVDRQFAFRSVGAPGLADELQAALRSDLLFERWRVNQPDPDNVDSQLGVVDETATVRGEARNLGVDLIVDTTLDGKTLSHRMRLLAGQQWQMRDVT